jgi:hypothetical protein
LERWVASLATGLAVATAAKADSFLLNYEAPGVQHTTATFSVMGVETFDAQPTGVGPGFSTDYGTSGAITGTYAGLSSGVEVLPADLFGGAGGTGNYIVAFPSTPYKLTLVNDPVKNPDGINFFGYWLSALDAGNTVTFYRGGVQVGSLTQNDVLAQVSGQPAYFGNPNPAFLGQDSEQPYAFINFYDTTGTFDEVDFSQNMIGGYESDNHTVGFFTKIGGVTAPEPSTWAMMLLSFAGLGFAGYRRARNARPVSA